MTRNRHPRPASQTHQLRAFRRATNTETSPYLTSATFSPHSSPLKRGDVSSNQKNPASVHLSTPELYERLRRAGSTGKHEAVMNIVRILIKDRRERPNTAMYASVIHSFVDAETGTAGKVRRVLDEMAEGGVELDARACHCVLEVRSDNSERCIWEVLI